MIPRTKRPPKYNIVAVEGVGGSTQYPPFTMNLIFFNWPLAKFYLLRRRVKKPEEDKNKNNTINSGHYVCLAAHELLSIFDQLCAPSLSNDECSSP